MYYSLSKPVMYVSFHQSKLATSIYTFIHYKKSVKGMQLNERILREKSAYK